MGKKSSSQKQQGEEIPLTATSEGLNLSYIIFTTSLEEDPTWDEMYQILSTRDYLVNDDDSMSTII